MQSPLLLEVDWGLKSESSAFTWTLRPAAQLLLTRPYWIALRILNTEECVKYRIIHAMTVYLEINLGSPLVYAREQTCHQVGLFGTTSFSVKSASSWHHSKFKLPLGWINTVLRHPPSWCGKCIKKGGKMIIQRLNGHSTRVRWELITDRWSAGSQSNRRISLGVVERVVSLSSHHPWAMVRWHWCHIVIKLCIAILHTRYLPKNGSNDSADIYSTIPDERSQLRLAQ